MIGLLTNPLSGLPDSRVASPTDTQYAKKQSAKLAETAKEFEATFLSILLKEMRQTLDTEEGLFQGDTSDVQGGLFDQMMSQHLAASGGVGFAPVVERQLQQQKYGQYQQSQQSAAPRTIETRA